MMTAQNRHVVSSSKQPTPPPRQQRPSRLKRFWTVFGTGFLSGFGLGGCMVLSLVSHASLGWPPQPLQQQQTIQQQQPQDSDWRTIHVYIGPNPNEASSIKANLQLATSPQRQHQLQLIHPHLLDVSAIPLDYVQTHSWFSQLGQDALIHGLLHGQRSGFFVDLAANDPLRLSNTFALEHYHDWQGLCVDANSQYWNGLAYRRRCTVVGAVVGGSNRTTQVDFRFHKDKGPKSGIVAPGQDNRSPQNQQQRRYAVPLVEILRKFHAPSVVDYLSLDVEGAEFFVLQGLDWDRYRFRVMTIERPSQELVRLLEGQGYTLLKKLPGFGETVWAHRDTLPHLNLTVLESLDKIVPYRDKERVKK